MRFPRLFSLLAAALLALAPLRAQTVVLTSDTTTLNTQGGTAVFTASFVYNTPPSVLALSITLPDGWTFVSTSNPSSFIFSPSAGQQGELAWSYLTAPQTPPTITFTATYPASVVALQNVAAKTIERTGTGAPPITTTNAPVYIESGSTLVSWKNGAVGEWGSAANWQQAVVPRNSQTEAFSAEVSSGSVNVTGTYNINNIKLLGGSVGGSSGQLWLNGLTSSWLAGQFSNLSILAIAPGARLTASGGDAHVFNDTNIINFGEFIWTGSGELASIGGNFANASGATFTDASTIAETFTQLSISEIGTLAPNSFLPEGGGKLAVTSTVPDHGVFLNQGTYLKTGASETRISAYVANSGTIAVNAGQLTFDGVFAQSDGKLIVESGAAVRFTQSPVFTGGQVFGRGIIKADAPVINNAFISPGSVLGQLAIEGDLTLQSLSNLFVDIGGTTQGVTYDYLSVTGTAILSGNLTLHLVDNALATLAALDTLTILTAGTRTGTFTGLADGARVFTSDSAASFRLNYTATAVTLTDFQLTVVPEPSTWALLIAGAGAIGFRALRRRRAS